VEFAAAVDADVDETELVFGVDACADEMLSTTENVLDPVANEDIGHPNLSVVAAGKVEMTAAGTVTDFTGAPSDWAVLVFIHKHVGVWVGMKLPVVPSPNDALV
jgi:hypothetical protein